MKAQEEYVWILNPKGRRVEVAASLVSNLLKEGYSEIGKEDQPGEALNKEFLEVIEI